MKWTAKDYAFWAVVILMFPVFWPISVGMIIYRSRRSKQKDAADPIEAQYTESRESTTTRQSSTASSARRTCRTKKKKVDAFVKKLSGKRLVRIIIGAVLALLGASSLQYVYDIYDVIDALIFLVPSAVLFLRAYGFSAQLSLYRRCLAIIGKRKAVRIGELADVSGLEHDKLTARLEKLLTAGAMPGAYIDYSRDLLVLSGDGIEDNELWQQATAQQESDEPADNAETTLADKKNEYLRQIRRVNDEIADEGLSADIDRIEQLVAKMFEAVERDADKSKELEHFLAYYMPMTLRILNAYRDFENGTAQGEKIRGTMDDIEEIMGTLVTGFERQLDMLYENDTLDIETDIRVLESMLAKDGLSDEGSIMPGK